MRLTQRLLDPAPAGNSKLQTLRQYYRLPERGAHTALGDVETVADLMQQVLRPLAEANGLTTWPALVAYAVETWFPSRIAFGKFKGRSVREARTDTEFHAWLKWLAHSANPRSAEMGHWYLRAISAPTDDQPSRNVTPVIDVGPNDGQGLVHYVDPQRETLRRLIDDARAQLAELEAEATREHHAVAVVRSGLSALLRPHYERRDTLRIVINNRRRYLDLLLIEGEEAADTVGAAYQQERAETERDYAETAAEAAQCRELSGDDAQEVKALFRRLVRLYHPDRFAHDPQKQASYARLTQEINQARDRGDIERLREISRDPNGFLERHGWGRLSFDDDADVIKLQTLYESLQVRIVSTLEALAGLRESSDYELCRLSRERPDLLETIAAQQAEAIREEIATLETEAAELAEEIENLTGADDPFGD